MGGLDGWWEPDVQGVGMTTWCHRCYRSYDGGLVFPLPFLGMSLGTATRGSQAMWNDCVPSLWKLTKRLYTSVEAICRPSGVWGTSCQQLSPSSSWMHTRLSHMTGWLCWVLRQRQAEGRLVLTYHQRINVSCMLSLERATARYDTIYDPLEITITHTSEALLNPAC